MGELSINLVGKARVCRPPPLSPAPQRSQVVDLVQTVNTLEEFELLAVDDVVVPT